MADPLLRSNPSGDRLLVCQRHADVTTPLLTTKLYIPPVRPGLVPRPRLVERLNAGTRSGRTPGVTLVSAPAGSFDYAQDRFGTPALHHRCK